MTKEVILKCDVCSADIHVDEEYFTVNVQLEKMDSKGKVFRGDEYPLYSVCQRCSNDVLLKGLVLSEKNNVSLTSEQSEDEELSDEL